MSSLELYKQKEETSLLSALSKSALLPYSGELLKLNQTGWKKILNHGDLERWSSGFQALPDVVPSMIDLTSDTIHIGLSGDCLESSEQIESALKQMHPWRKGPFDFFGVHIDTEWRSDWKWNRLKDGIAPLEGRNIMDVGCGSGYHMWRMLGAGAALVIGVDPTPLFSLHFASAKRYQPETNAFMLPVGIDDMPKGMGCFDSVFSMGILYHRRSPLDHLIQLREQLRPGGELVLETLVIEGDKHCCLIPEERYAKMRNVWFIPSVDMLHIWLGRAGFKDICTIDVSPTIIEEQRSSDWMRFESLADYLDNNNPGLTIEGHPAPIRATLTATI